MTKYLDEKGLEHVFKRVVDIADTAKEDVFETIGKANGIASLDDNGFVPIAQLGNLDMDFFSVVTELPTTDIKKHIYAIKNPKLGKNDTYSEYVYTGDVTAPYDSTKWEKLGDFVPSVDLNGYAKEADVIHDIDIQQNSKYFPGTTGFAITMANGGQPIYSKPLPAVTSLANGLMQKEDKTKLDKIDLEALSQSISNANDAADRVDASINSCKTATKEAENVNISIENNTINITDRNGVTKSTTIEAISSGIPDKSITRVKIADWAVGRDQIEDNSITNGKIEDRSVSTYKIELEGVKLENLHPEVFNKIKDEYLPLNGSATIEGNVTASGFKVVDQTIVGLLCSDGTVSAAITQSEIDNICN